MNIQQLQSIIETLDYLQKKDSTIAKEITDKKVLEHLKFNSLTLGALKKKVEKAITLQKLELKASEEPTAINLYNVGLEYNKYSRYAKAMEWYRKAADAGCEKSKAIVKQIKNKYDKS